MALEFSVVIKSPPVDRKSEWQEVHEFDEEIRLLDFEIHVSKELSSGFHVDLDVGRHGQERILMLDQHFSPALGKHKWGPDPKGLPTKRIAIRAQADEPGKDLYLTVRVTPQG